MSDSKKALRWGAFFVAWLLAAPALAEKCDRPGAGEPVISRHVIDGDTLELSDGRRVRLIGINTPELGRNGQPSEPYAQRARAALERQVAQPGLRLLVGEQPRDHYGRTLGHLFDAQGVNVEAQLLREGMGFAIGVPPNLSLFDCHLQQEAVARGAGVGVWRQNPVVAAGKMRGGGFHLVRGKVRSIERTRDHVWVELDGALVLRVLAADRHRFDRLDDWIGKELEVRGWVVDRKSRRAGRQRFMLSLQEPRMVVVQNAE